jgi:hypothetical protein
MGLAPGPHPLGPFAIAEVGKVLGFTIPSPLAGELAGRAAIGLAAVMLMLPVPVIREEERAATAALASLRLWAHREPKPTQPPPESKPKQRGRRTAKRKKQEKLSGEEPEEKPREEDGNIKPAVFREYHSAADMG